MAAESGCGDYEVAGDDYGQRVAGVGCADGAGGARGADTLRQFAVGGWQSTGEWRRSRARGASLRRGTAAGVGQCAACRKRAAQA